MRKLFTLVMLMFSISMFAQNKKISDFPLTLSVDGTEDVPLLQFGINKRVKMSTILSSATPSVSNGLHIDAGVVKLGGNLIEKTSINQNGHNFAINGQPGSFFTKWDYGKGDLIITDDTTSMSNSHTNVTNIIYGNTDSLRGSVSYNLISGTFNKIDGRSSGSFSNIVQGANNSLQNAIASLISGYNNVALSNSDDYSEFVGNFVSGINTRMYSCTGCFAFGSNDYTFLTPLYYKPVVVGQTGTHIYSAFNYSHNSNAQTYGNGVHSNYASILGGSDHNIATGASGSGIFGGRQIHLVSGDSNIVAFPRVRIFQGLNASATNDNTLTLFLAIDGSGNVKTRTFPSNASGALTNNGSGGLSWVSYGTGSVTSVGVTDGSNITHSGGPITSSGNITINAVPSGGNSQVQYNNGGIPNAFAGSSNFTFTGTALNLTSANYTSSDGGVNAISIGPTQTFVNEATNIYNFLGATLQLDTHAQYAGLNVGSLAGNPSTTNNADVWYNSTTKRYRGKENSSLVDFVTSADIFSSSQPGAVPNSSGLTTEFLNGSGAWSAPFVLTTTGSGAATFSGGTLNIPNSSGAVAGSNTQIQYNNSGAFGASSNFTFNSGTTVVSLGSSGSFDGSSNALAISANAHLNLTSPSGSTFSFNGGLSIATTTGTLALSSTSGGNVSITVSGGSHLFLNGLPTSSSGLSSGAIWSNSGVLTIVP